MVGSEPEGRALRNLGVRRSFRLLQNATMTHPWGRHGWPTASPHDSQCCRLACRIDVSLWALLLRLIRLFQASFEQA